jgi:hypothetical protein
VDRGDASEADETARYARFDRLQARMPAVWDAIRQDLPGEAVVVLPSMSIDLASEFGPGVSQAYEERFLFMLLLLRQPRLRLVYLTSVPVPPDVVDYYLGLLPGVIASHARARLHLVAVGDASARPLSLKLLERPRLLARVADLLPDRSRAHLVPFMTTTLERDVALALDIPVYGADPRLETWGTKSGSRRLFAAVGVPHPRGTEGVRSLDDVVAAVGALREAPEGTGLRGAVVKLDEGVSGMGNAFVDLERLGEPGAPGAVDELRARVAGMRLEGPGATLEGYLDQLAAQGGVVEERITGLEIRSPSVQLRVLPDRAVELLSTHDQLLGGPTGQSFLGARFPADPAYAATISVLAMRVGERLAREGALGRFAVDFVVERDGEGDEWAAYAIEVNLRKGGTTHPFLTLQFLTDGTYDARSARFTTASGQEKHLVATDHLESPALRALTVDDLFDVVVRHGLHFDQTRQTGIVLHMLSSLTEQGRVDLTSVGNTAADAERGYREAERVLLAEAAAAAGQSEVS